jgi:hypothetical protein
MTVFMVETYIVKPDKLGEAAAHFKKFETWVKEHPELLKEVKSTKIFTHLLGGNWGGYVVMTEFENLAEGEKWENKFMKSGYMTTLYPEWASLLVAGSYSISIWNSVP